MVILAVAVGTVLGYLSALGIGGGTLLILWLTYVMGTEAATARAINLMYFLVCAGTVTLFRFKNRSLDFKRLLPGVIAGCFSAAAFSWLSGYMEIQLLKKLFGGLLILTGIKELFYRPRKLR
jgi:uncharacterized membrane protein YfcA